MTPPAIPNYPSPPPESEWSLSQGAIAGAVIGAVLGAALLIAASCLIIRRCFTGGSQRWSIDLEESLKPPRGGKDLKPSQSRPAQLDPNDELEMSKVGGLMTYMGLACVRQLTVRWVVHSSDC